VILTLGNWQEANQNEAILVCSPDMIMDVSDREVDGVVFLLAGCDGNSCFIASEYDGNEDSSVCINIYSDEVLSVERLVNIHALCETHLHIASRPSSLT